MVKKFQIAGKVTKPQSGKPEIVERLTFTIEADSFSAAEKKFSNGGLQSQLKPGWTAELDWGTLRLKHFEIEVLKHAFCKDLGHHRVQLGVFDSLEKLRAKLSIAPRELLNRCLFEIIPRDRFKIGQENHCFLDWTSENADGGENASIYNNLMGRNFRAGNMKLIWTKCGVR